MPLGKFYLVIQSSYLETRLLKELENAVDFNPLSCTGCDHRVTGQYVLSG